VPWIPDAGRVLSVSRRETHRLSKDVVDRITLLEGLGVEGDAHAGATVKHRSRVRKDPLPVELFDELEAKGFEIVPAQMGENVTTEGVDLYALPRGARLRLGADAIVELTGLRNPCKQLEGLAPGLMKAVLDEDVSGALVRKAGVMAIVRASGEVGPGDAIAIALPPEPHEKLAKV
jgi:MOSC domain-containing protein YiiM